MESKPRYINVGGKLIDLSIPKVMGIINVTPDSFYQGSRYSGIESVIAVAGKMIEEGADMLDIGGYSSRPGARFVEQAEERERVINAVKSVTRKFPGAIISVDTFRAGIASEAVLECGAHIINDISGGDADENMFELVAELNVPYILMHMQGTPDTMQKNPVYDDIVADLLKWFAIRLVKLQRLGVKDIIVDPGFGFGKTVQHNFRLLNRLSEFSITGMPLLAGLSRKSVIWKTLGITPDEALNGTTALNMVALMNGADILRVHDVKEAVQTVKLFLNIKENNDQNIVN